MEENGQQRLANKNEKFVTFASIADRDLVKSRAPKLAKAKGKALPLALAESYTDASVFLNNFPEFTS